MSKQEPIIFEGIVESALPNAEFMVKLLNYKNAYVLAHNSGSVRKNRIRILVGDKVIIAVSRNDRTKDKKIPKGRIVRRN